MSTTPATLDASGATHVGQRRLNEDAIHIDSDLGLMLVADGVGGREAGEIASAITCEVIASGVSSGVALGVAVASANRAVRVAVEEGRGKEGMASTVVAVHFSGSDYRLAWVGDSRVYLWDGQLKLLTQDHSYVQELLTRGEITREEARNHPRRNVIAQAIGAQDDTGLRVDENHGTLQQGQVLLLCSDGLSDMVDNADISRILADSDGIEECCQSLVDTAVNAGGKDNISVVLVVSRTAVDAGECLQPNISWCFDPASGEYTDGPDRASSAHTVTRIKPTKTDEASAEHTQMMSSGKSVVTSGIPSQAPQQESPQRSRSLLIWVLLVAGAAAAGLLYSFGIPALG